MAKTKIAIKKEYTQEDIFLLIGKVIQKAFLRRDEILRSPIKSMHLSGRNKQDIMSVRASELRNQMRKQGLMTFGTLYVNNTKENGKDVQGGQEMDEVDEEDEEIEESII